MPAGAFVDTATGLSAEDGMQPAGDMIGDVKANGPAAERSGGCGAEAGEVTLRRGNGASPFEYDLLHALQAMRIGDFSVRMAGDQEGLAGKIADTFNEIAAANQRIA